MKIQHERFLAKRGLDTSNPAHAGERGMATLLFIVLLAIMAILAASSLRTILHLRAEENLIEQRQIQRLNATQTNVVAVAELPAKPEPK